MNSQVEVLNRGVWTKQTCVQAWCVRACVHAPCVQACMMRTNVRAGARACVVVGGGRKHLCKTALHRSTQTAGIILSMRQLPPVFLQNLGALHLTLGTRRLRISCLLQLFKEAGLLNLLRERLVHLYSGTRNQE